MPEQQRPTIDAFSVIPGLVVDLLGGPAIVVGVDRDHDHEVNTLTLNTATGTHTIGLEWAGGQRVTVLGVTVDNAPDNIDLFDA
jgi:hypothetical protein